MKIALKYHVSKRKYKLVKRLQSIAITMHNFATVTLIFKVYLDGKFQLIRISILTFFALFISRGEGSRFLEAWKCHFKMITYIYFLICVGDYLNNILIMLENNWILFRKIGHVNYFSKQIITFYMNFKGLVQTSKKIKR